MQFDDKDDKHLLDWEKVNATEYVRKSKIAEKEKLDNRVIAIEDRCVETWNDLFSNFKYLIYSMPTDTNDLVGNILQKNIAAHLRLWFNHHILTHSLLVRMDPS